MGSWSRGYDATLTTWRSAVRIRPSPLISNQIGGEVLTSHKYKCKICGKEFTPVKAMYHIMYEHNKDDHNVWLEPLEK